MSDAPRKQDWLSTPARPGAPEPDAAGQAALLLVESLMHQLVEARLLTLDQAVGTVETAADVKVEVAHGAGEEESTLRQSLKLLQRIERSMAAKG